MVEVLMRRNHLAEQLGPEPGGREDLGLHQPGAGLSGQARFLRNHPCRVLGADRPGSGRPGGGVDADPRRPGQGQGPPQAVPQGRHAPLTRPGSGVGPAGWPRQRPVRVRVQGPGRGVGTAGEAVP